MGDQAHPLRDVHWALGQLRDRFSTQIPVCLVGHSLGGRAALLAAREPAVVSAVALAPWVLPSDAPHGIDGKAILIVHGDRDRIASPSRSAQLARRMSDHARVDYITVPGGKHAMLRRHNEFSGPAAEFACASLLQASTRFIDSARVGRG